VGAFSAERRRWVQKSYFCRWSRWVSKREIRLGSDIRSGKNGRENDQANISVVQYDFGKTDLHPQVADSIGIVRNAENMQLLPIYVYASALCVRWNGLVTPSWLVLCWIAQGSGFESQRGHLLFGISLRGEISQEGFVQGLVSPPAISRYRGSVRIISEAPLVSEWMLIFVKKDGGLVFHNLNG
jgi:hypothetical protein